MAEVKWIKLTVSMFDDEKINLIQSMPEGDSLLVVWIRLLVLAGRVNDNGFIYLSEGMPYTDEMLATIFNKQLNIIRLALRTFEKFGMIEMTAKGIYLPTWEKHQNVEGMEKIREQTRKRVAEHRERLKIKGCNVTETLHVTQSNATEEDIDIDIDIDKDIKHIVEQKPKHEAIEQEKIPFSEIVNYLNSVCGTSYKSSTKVTREHINARWNEGFRLDDFKKVIDHKASDWLKDSEMAQFLRPQTLFGNKFESYLNSIPMGKKLPRAYESIRQWVEEEEDE